MSPLHLRNLAFQRNPPEDREGFSRTRRPGGGHLGHSGGWQYIEGNNNHSTIHITAKHKLKPGDWKDMDQVLQLHQLLKDLFQWRMDNKSFNLASHWEEVGASFQKICLKYIAFNTLRYPPKGEPSHYPSYRRTTDPDRAHSDSFKLTRSRESQLSSRLTPFRNQHISGQESQLFTIPGIFKEKTRTQAQKQDIFQPKAERVRPNDPEAVGLGEESTQEPEIVVHTSRISSPINRNITPTQI
ncbi:hypothetical protein O181_103636 [Austropuccinia psidii MF-1]|uniref:Uncharacterized protein n=1 Tax=Austropuccinia psidii MF-1 TaxID=1389203 RepID=A0A9Q3JL19_9BASI|nr:hypothetical protein [Austropuccinia psidii MF-1]